MSALTHGPLLWFLNRGTGVSLLVLFTVTTALGVLSARPGGRRLVPALVTQGLHRNLSLVSLALLTAHVLTAVVDTYVDIRWWQAFSPVGATYQPLWLGAGALALDLLVVLVVTSLLRHRIPHRLWRGVHWLGYAAWAVSLAHGVGIGTDATTTWGQRTGLACVVVVALCVAVRTWAELRARQDPALSPAVPR